MSISLRADASRAVVVLDGVDRVAFNEDGSMELLTPAAGTPDANDVPTFGTSLASVAAIATTSGTVHAFTAIPSWAKRITVMFNGVSTNGTSAVLLQVGTSAGVEVSGYGAVSAELSSIVSTTNYSTGFGISGASGTNLRSGSIVLTRINPANNNWVASGTVGLNNNSFISVVAGNKSLTAPLDRIRLTTVNGTDVFDAGTVNIMWE